MAMPYGCALLLAPGLLPLGLTWLMFRWVLYPFGLVLGYSFWEFLKILEWAVGSPMAFLAWAFDARAPRRRTCSPVLVMVLTLGGQC